MGFKRKPGTDKNVFTLTLPVNTAQWQLDKLDRYFKNCNHLKNTLIEQVKVRVEQLVGSPEWLANKDAFAALYKKYATEEEQASVEFKQAKSALSDERAAMIHGSCLTKCDIIKEMTQVRTRISPNVNSAIAQVLAQDVSKAVDSILFKDGEEMRFSPINDFRYIRGNSNTTGIVCDYKSVTLRIKHIPIVYKSNQPRKPDSQKRPKKNTTEIRLPFELENDDRYDYQKKCLYDLTYDDHGRIVDMKPRTIHYCGISRYPSDKVKGGWLYCAVITIGGFPPAKIDKYTGELRDSMPKGRVGHDIGTQTLASVGDEQTNFTVLAADLDLQKEYDDLARINNAIDDSKRATNPEMFAEDGQVIPINKLPRECTVRSHGTLKRKWKKSPHCIKLEIKRRTVYARITRQRTNSHHRLANKLLHFGDEHYIETMNFKALQKKAKEAKKKEDGTYTRRKRFGKSIANRSPAAFVAILKSKVERLGGHFYKIETKEAKASQYDHTNQVNTPKGLGERWHTLSSGAVVQRDLYSAFLLQNCKESLDGFVQELLENKFEHFLQMQHNVIESLKSVRSTLPSSMGI